MRPETGEPLEYGIALLHHGDVGSIAVKAAEMRVPATCLTAGPDAWRPESPIQRPRQENYHRSISFLE